MAARVEGPAAPAVPRSFSAGLPFRSLISKLMLLLVIFCAVPVILYIQFREADAEKRFLLMESVREQGRMVAESLRPLLEQQEISSLPLLNDEVARFATKQTGVKVLFRPSGEYGAESFYFVASQPTIAPTELAEERDRLVERGVFDNLAQSCWGELSMALRHRRPSGAEELLTSITPINTGAGCWAVITTHSTTEFLGTSIDQPYWKTIEVRIAAAIYFAMAIFTIGLFVSIWRGLMRFRRLARSIRTGASHVSFAQQNRVPELAPVAEEFDMDWGLHDSSERMKVLIMVSNFGHCLNDLLYRWRIGALPIDIVGVVSNHLTYQKLVVNHDIPFHHIKVTKENKPEAEAKLMDVVRDSGAELVVLARYMQILSDTLCKEMSGRIINIHPSLLPKHKGLDTHARALHAGDTVHGCSVHHVTAGMDDGPVICQAEVKIRPDDTPETLAARVLEEEHRIYPLALAKIASRDADK